MNAARCRIAGEGEFEKEWKRLLGFKRARVSTEGPAEVEAALGADIDGLDAGVTVVFFSCSVVIPSERLLRSEPKLRIHGAARREEARHCRRVLCRST